MSEADAIDPLRDDDGEDGDPSPASNRGGARNLAKKAGQVEPRDTVPERTETSGRGSFDDPTGSTQFLSHLLTRSPFMDYFCRVAVASHSQKSEAARVQKAKEEHRKFFLTCVMLDLLLIFVATVLILAITSVVAYKTLFT